MNDLKIIYIDPARLRPRESNPRTHSQKQIRQIEDSIGKFGFANPILIDRDDGIVAGHGRVEAAKRLGLKEVPTICLEELTEAQIRAYVITDNRLAELAGWNRELLTTELQGLIELDLDFEVTVTGFDTGDIDVLIGEQDEEPVDDPADDVPDVEGGPPVTSPGDVWILGAHRLICGDSRTSETYGRLLDGAKAQMVFTDPPYNVRINGHVSGLGKVKHREFGMASGEMSKNEFTAFLETVFKNMTDVSAGGAIHYICMDWRHMTELLAAGDTAYSELKNLCVWSKTNAGMGSYIDPDTSWCSSIRSARRPISTTSRSGAMVDTVPTSGPIRA